MERSKMKNLKMLGLGAVFSLGLLALGAAPAEAKPPAHAKAWGYRAQQAQYYSPFGYRDYSYRDFGSRYSSRWRDRDRDRIPDWRDRYIGGRFDSPWPTRRDWDRDGRRNSKDWDLDNDGIRNRRDRDRDGDGVGNRRDRHPRRPRRR
jgi:hypothetical protein